VLKACERSADWDAAVELLARMKAEGVTPDRVSYTSAVRCAFTLALALTLAITLALALALALALTLTLTLILTLTRSRRLVARGCLYYRRRLSGACVRALWSSVRPRPPCVWSMQVGAAGRANEWETALGLWQQLLAEGIEIDALALTTLVRALTRSSQWEAALFVFERALELAPSVCTSGVFAAALEACEVGGQRDAALQLLQTMRERRVLVSAACYHFVCAACVAGGDWRAALSALQDMLRQEQQPQAETWRLVHDACRAAERDEEADGLIGLAEQAGVPLLALTGAGAAGGTS
jgi:pentatricopeptide repeat protein